MTTGARRLAAALLFALPGVSGGDDLWQVYQIALTEDSAYRAAGYEYARAQLDLPLARSALRPTLALRGSREQNRDFVSGRDRSAQPNSLSLNASMRLFDGPLRGQVSQAAWRVSVAQIRFEEAEDALIIRVAERYFRRLAAADAKEVARLAKVAIQRQRDLAAKRLEVGFGTRTDLFEAEARLQQAVADLIVADNEINNAAQALKQITGGRITRGAAPSTLDDNAPLPPPEPASMDAWIARALRHNLALAAADLNLKIAEEEIAKQRAARWPSLTLDASRQWRDGEARGGQGDTDSASIAATLNWPLYLGNSIRLSARQAALQRDAAWQSREAMRRQVETDATAAYLATASGISQVNALLEAVRAGASALQAKAEGFRAGLTTNREVLDAQRDLSQSRTDYLRARYDFILSTLRLQQTAGSLDATHVKRINAWLVQDP